MRCSCWAPFFRFSPDVISQSRRDKIAFELLLSNSNKIDTVEYVIIGRQTNMIRAPRVTRILEWLSNSNRVDVASSSKTSEYGWLRLSHGTNKVGAVGLYDGGLIVYGRYCFRLRTGGFPPE